MTICYLLKLIIFFILNIKSMKHLFIYFALMTLLLPSISSAQVASMPVGRSFIIQSAQNYGRDGNGCWDVSGSYSSESQFIKGKNIQLWTMANKPDRFFTIKSSSQQGFYEIMVGKHSVARVDISGGNQKKGANIHLWDDNNSTAQRFSFKHMGNGRFKIYTTKGKIINLNTQSSKNGTNVQLWNDHNGIHNEWFLLDADTRQAYIPTSTVKYTLKGAKMPHKSYYIQSAVSYGRTSAGYWDIPGNGTSKLNNGANLQIWSKGNAQDRKYTFVKNANGQYYNIKIGSTNYFVDLIGGKTKNASNIAAWSKNGKTNQDFYLQHLGNGRFKIHHISGKIVALAGGAKEKNGTNIHLWDDHNAVQAEWYLIDAATNKPYIPSGSSNNNSSENSGWGSEKNEGSSSGSEGGGW